MNATPDIDSDAEFIRKVREALGEGRFVNAWVPRLIALAADGVDRRSEREIGVARIFGERFSWERS